MNKPKPLFVPRTEAHFVVSAEILQAFINHLNEKKILVQPPQPVGDDRTFHLEVSGRDELSAADASEVIATFQPPQP